MNTFLIAKNVNTTTASRTHTQH